MNIKAVRSCELSITNNLVRPTRNNLREYNCIKLEFGVRRWNLKLSGIKLLFPGYPARMLVTVLTRLCQTLDEYWMNN
jgi:hypothetical protein